MSAIHSSHVTLPVSMDQDTLDRLDRLTLILRNDPRLAVELGIPGKVTRASLIDVLLTEGLAALEKQVLARS